MPLAQALGALILAPLRLENAIGTPKCRDLLPAFPHAHRKAGQICRAHGGGFRHGRTHHRDAEHVGLELHQKAVSTCAAVRAHLRERNTAVPRHGVHHVRILEGNGFQRGADDVRASRAAGLKEVPVRILEADDKLAMELALVENLQREDLNPMEEAAGYKKLMDDYNLTQEQVASRVQKSRPAVTNALRLLSLGETLQKKVSSGKLSAGHARALLPLKTETLREKAAAEVESRGLSVRQTETLVASLLRQAEQPEKEEKKPPVVDYVREAEKALSDALGRGVKFQGGQKKGRIALEFYSADDREALMEALKHMDKPWKKK